MLGLAVVGLIWFADFAQTCDRGALVVPSLR